MAAEDTRASTWRAFEHGTLANWCDTTNSVRHHPLFSVFLTPVQPPVLPSFWFCNAAVRKALLDFDSELKVWHKMMLEKAPPLLKQNPRQWLQQIFDNTQGVNSGKIWPLLTSQQALQCIDRTKWKHWPDNALAENWNVDPVLCSNYSTYSDPDLKQRWRQHIWNILQQCVHLPSAIQTCVKAGLNVDEAPVWVLSDWKGRRVVCRWLGSGWGRMAEKQEIELSF